jgi:hypothetical protein
MEEFIPTVDLPVGQLLFDRSTYRIWPLYYLDLNARFRKKAAGYSKILIVTDGLDHPLGAVFFDYADNLTMYMRKDYRNKGIMSELCKNGILRSECYEYQAVNIPPDMIDSFEYFQMLHHMLLCAGLRISNLSDCYERLLTISPDVETAYGDGNRSSFVAAYGVDAAYERTFPGASMARRLAESTNLVLYDDRTKLTVLTDELVRFEYRPTKQLVMTFTSAGSDIPIGLFAVEAMVKTWGGTKVFFSSDQTDNAVLSQHIPWSQLPEFLKYFMSIFEKGTRWIFNEDPNQVRARFEHKLEKHLCPEFFTYVRDFR